MGHLVPSRFMMELYFIVATLSAIAVPEAFVASPSSSFGMDHQETVDLLIRQSSPSKPNETSMKAFPLIPTNLVSRVHQSNNESCLFLNSTRGICQVKVLTPRVQPWYLVMEIERPLPQD
ncbi:hypothetical protein AMTRI_Chr07g30120 [Amborella trichopoda]